MPKIDVTVITGINPQNRQSLITSIRDQCSPFMPSASFLFDIKDGMRSCFNNHIKIGIDNPAMIATTTQRLRQDPLASNPTNSIGKIASPVE